MIVTISAAAGFLVPGLVSASVQDFYFSDMHTDFYLSKQDDGSSKMRVQETLVAEFPDYAQNKGLEHAIPRTNQDGANVTFANTSVTVTRNGLQEPIWGTDKNQDFFVVSTGTNSYILGQQTFGFEYNMVRVITDFENHQELYWDVNGTKWKQKFDKVSATVWFDEASARAFTGQTECFTGVQGSIARTCTVTVAEDGRSVTITAERALFAGENLSFTLGFQANSFVVPPPQVSYDYFIFGMIIFAIIFLLSLVPITGYFKNVRGPKKQFERSVVPEYPPPKDISVYEAARLLGERRSGNVITAQIIDLAVRGHIKIIEGEATPGFGQPKKTYSLEIITRDGLRPEEVDFLRIIFSGDQERVEVKRYASETMATFLRAFWGRTAATLAKNDYLKDAKDKPLHKTLSFSSYFFVCIFLLILLPIFQVAFTDSADALLFGQEAVVSIAVILMIVAFTIGVSSSFTYPSVISKRTSKGWDTYYYLKGLEMYIKYAETERLRFLQSVQGAERIDINDKTAVVKLYEKLLPYAVLFRQEKSWAAVIQLYESELGVSPSWVSSVGAFSMVSFMSSSGGSFGQSMASSYGSSSSSSGSGFSGGGGGGGGSGGGGGGGGGGGR